MTEGDNNAEPGVRVECAGGCSCRPLTLDGHAVKVIVVRAKSLKSGQAIQTYPVGSENATLQRKIAEHGTPKSMPTISTEAIEVQLSTGAVYVARDCVITAPSCASPAPSAT